MRVLTAKAAGTTDKHSAKAIKKKHLFKRSPSETYYSISPGSFSDLHASHGEVNSDDPANSSSEKVEYFSISSQGSKLSDSLSVGASCDIDAGHDTQSSSRAIESERAFMQQPLIKLDEEKNHFCLTPDEDFMRDGYCRCSFCNHDDLVPNISISQEETVDKSFALVGNAGQHKPYVNSEAPKKLISRADVTECNPPWMKQRKPRDLSKVYLDSSFHRSAVMLFRQCEKESLQEEQVNCHALT